MRVAIVIRIERLMPDRPETLTQQHQQQQPSDTLCPPNIKTTQSHRQSKCIEAAPARLQRVCAHTYLTVCHAEKVTQGCRSLITKYISLHGRIRSALLCVAALFTCVVAAAAQQTSATPEATATISGTAVDVDGALVPDAHLDLIAADATIQQLTSSSDGSFSFAHVAPGNFTIRFRSHGFQSGSIAGNAKSGESVTLAPIVLKPAATLELDVTPDDPYTAEQQIHLEEQQRLLGFAPNFFVSYQWNAPPLTSKEKYKLAWANGRDPANLLLVGTVAGVQQARNEFNGYGQGAQGYGKRFGADFANLEIGTFVGGAVLPSVFHQDPRYFYKGTGTVRSRIVYALSSAVICRGDNGHREPAFAGVLGDLSTGAISNLYYPASNRNGPALTFENGLLAIGGDALNGLVQEFLLRKFTPGTH